MEARSVQRSQLLSQVARRWYAGINGDHLVSVRPENPPTEYVLEGNEGLCVDASKVSHINHFFTERRRTF